MEDKPLADSQIKPLAVDTRGAARLIGLSPATLETWRSRGTGPPYRKIGRKPLYLVAELERWLAAQPRFTNTSQDATSGGSR